MAKTSMKVKKRDHRNSQPENILAARFVADHTLYLESTEFAEFASENLHIRARFLVLESPAGKI